VFVAISAPIIVQSFKSALTIVESLIFHSIIFKSQSKLIVQFVQSSDIFLLEPVEFTGCQSEVKNTFCMYIDKLFTLVVISNHNTGTQNINNIISEYFLNISILNIFNINS
jgi:hypothetical protein